MKTLALIAGAMMLASAAPAVEGPVSSSIPPERFRALGAVPVVPFDQLNDYCGVPRSPDKTLLGCTRQLKRGPKVVFLPDACPAAEAGDFYALIVCHETAHALGGWSRDHEI